ncbi:MAG: chorismate synthase, partial [Nitrospirota bacterium]
LTAGESHGRALAGIIEGVPAGLALVAEDIDRDLKRRQGGYGRGGRMKIESDRVQILSGVRWGKTLGSPIALLIENLDWENWRRGMSPEASEEGSVEAVTRPRPGHADLAGALKYHHRDIRNVLERSSARETAMRVALGAVARRLMGEFGIRAGSFVTEIGREGFEAGAASAEELQDLAERAGSSPLRCPDEGATGKMMRLVDEGVEVGLGFRAARSFGSEVMDEIVPGEEGPARTGNNAGGIEGGISNGMPIVLRAAMKPIPTQRKPLRSVDIVTGKAVEAAYERSDVCAVPAASVIGEAMALLVVAEAFMEKFGGDSVEETGRNFRAYLESLRGFPHRKDV